MTAAAIKYFDTHEFVKECKRLGLSEELAEYQVKQYEKAIEVAVTNVKDEIKLDDLATKDDLKKEIELLRLSLQKEIIHSRNQMILWMVTILMASGLIQHFFK